MKHILSLMLLFFVFTILSLPAVAQPKLKLGKVSIEELEMKVYSLDSTAQAVILGEDYNLNIKYSQSTGFQLAIEVQKRIKILSEDAIDNWGNISFSLYAKNGNSEKLIIFKGSTSNLVDGKIVVEKLGLKDVFEENASETTTSKKFTFKNVQVGSVIEYNYTIVSDYFSRIPDLYAQYSIPVVWSEITFEYPKYFKYKYFITGAEPIYKKESENNVEVIGNLTFDKIRDYWVFKDMPSMKQLTYMRPVENYREKIKYELYSIDIPGSLYKNYSSSWEEINKDLIVSNDFGTLLDRLGPTESIAAGLGVRDSSDLVKVLTAVHYIQKNYLWNDIMGIYPSDKWRKNIKEQKGSAPDLNFTLITLLKNLGLEAYPVLLSTRSNGTVFRSFPSTDAFNYIITAVKLKGKFVLIDPSSEFTGLDILPEYCLNGEGLLIKQSGPQWISVESGNPYNISEGVIFTLSKDLKVTTNYQAKYSDYAAYFLRDNIDKKGGQEKFIKETIENNKDLNITNYSFENLDDLSKPVIKKYTANPEDYLEEMGDLILFKPIFFPNFTENPFKKDKRAFPVDFTYPRSYSHTVVIELPEGYAFDETPKNSRVANPDRSLSFSVNYALEGNKLTMLMEINIKSAFFTTDRYPEIKSFFDNVVAKENEKIVIHQI